MDKDKEQHIRERAYQIWQDEGRPLGRDKEHWKQASSEIQEEEAMTKGHHDFGNRREEKSA